MSVEREKVFPPINPEVRGPEGNPFLRKKYGIEKNAPWRAETGGLYL